MISTQMMAQLIAAMIVVESGGDNCALNEDEDAVGCLQIRPIYLDDVNNVSQTLYEPEDRYDRKKSIEMVTLYLSYWGWYFERVTGKEANAEVLARIQH